MGEYAKEDPDAATNFAGVSFQGGKINFTTSFSAKMVLNTLKGNTILLREYAIDEQKNEIRVALVEGKRLPYLLIKKIDEKNFRYEQVPPNRDGEHAVLSFIEKIDIKD
ncbi:MAG: hypothetical protein ACRCVN_05825 [Spirochaetia bacterium]